jgi:glycerol-3-phosphate acyltransferase PlsX
MKDILKTELCASPVRKLGAILAQGALRALKRRMDPEVYGGAVLLGLNGNVIKTHGSARERAFMNAIRVAAEEIRHGVNLIISQRIARANERLAAAPTAASTSIPA